MVPRIYDKIAVSRHIGGPGYFTFSQRFTTLWRFQPLRRALFSVQKRYSACYQNNLVSKQKFKMVLRRSKALFSFIEKAYDKAAAVPRYIDVFRDGIGSLSSLS